MKTKQMHEEKNEAKVKGDAGYAIPGKEEEFWEESTKE